MKWQVNEIANMAFITGRTNQRLSRKPPAKNFQEIINGAARCVPDDDGVGMFVVTAYDLAGKAMKAHNRRMRKRGFR